MANKINIGFVGAGTVGQMHISHWSKLSNCNVLALADMRHELLNLATKKFKIPLSYSSHTELIKNPDINAVVVVTRRHNTACVVYDCLQAGKHVFSEKPMAKTLNQAIQLVESAEKNGRIYSIGHQRRHDAGTQIAKKIFDNIMQTQELGKVIHVRSWNFTGQDRIPTDDFVMTQEERPNAPMWDQVPDWIPSQFHNAYDRFINVFSHDTNILRYFFGKNPEVKFVDLDNEQGQVAIFTFGGFSCVFEGGLNELNKWEDRGAWDEGLEIFFERGRLRVKFSAPLIHELCSRVEIIRGSQPVEVLCDGTNKNAAFQLQASQFIDDILEDREAINSGKDTVEDLKIIESIWRQYLMTKGVV